MLALNEGGDVVTLRRCTQAACRVTGLTGSSLVRLTTVVSESANTSWAPRDSPRSSAWR
ncbi:hypothetical protein QQY24_26640 [Streptomyces sp. TG1A-8]|uniref:hypothetical protein n=1 Tax=Streptomyces sp. TG1A-8 TaxID=3051385 RepID=UPI00265C7FDC|nr:hypothetical protein [Streptomyces sp. TG1A-8]MDO0928817.1 hypothetical protein [Streptomyces sp. TG1A-8]